MYSKKTCRLTYIIVGVLLLAVSLIAPQSVGAATRTSDKTDSDYILIINSYAESSDWSNSFISPVYESLLANKSPLTAYTEHMNMLMINNDKQLQDYKNSLFGKYAENAPKIIMLIGNTPWSLLKKDIESRWRDVPVILCAEKDYMGSADAYLTKYAIPKEQRIPLDKYGSPMKVTVIHNPVYIKETVDVMKNLLPGMNKIMFLSDKRYISAQNRDELDQIMRECYPNVSVSHIVSEDITMNALIDSLKWAETDTGVLFFSWYKKSMLSGNMILSTNDFKMFNRYTASPIFTLSDYESANAGMLGGYYYDNKAIAKIVDKAITDVLSQKTRKNFVLEDFGRATPVINYKVLQDKYLSPEQCSEDTIFYMKTLTVWELYKYWIMIGVLVVLGIFLFIIMKMWMLGKIKKEQNEQIKLMKNYGSLFDNMPIAYAKQSLVYNQAREVVDFVVLDVNPYYEKYFMSRGDVLGKRGSELDLSSFGNYLNLYNIAISDNKSITVQYYHPQTSNYFSMIITPSKGEGDIELFFVDNTELANAQQLLNTLNHKLAMALEVANITPWKWDLEQKTILCDVNRSVDLGTKLKITPEDQLSVPDRMYFDKICKRDRDRVMDAYRNLIEGRVQKIKEEYRIFVRNNGKSTYEWVEAQAVIDRADVNGKPLSLIGSSQVISDRKKMEEDLVDAKEKAEESNRLKSAFLANMSHEIRTPLNAIVGFSEVLASAEGEDEKHEYVSIIENNNTLLLQLISDILDLSKIEAGTLDLVSRDFDLGALFGELEMSAQMRVSAESVKVVYERQMPECYVNTDKNRVTQVVMNFINNAIKFTVEGSIRFGFRLQDPQTLYFYVTDTGCGISEGDLGRVFGRFVKLNNFAQGTGLGLSICETIVHHLGGEIGAVSELGKGSTFWFTLPYRPAKEEVKTEEYFEPQIVDTNRLTVLIAEDNASNFKLFETILKSEYEILHAWDGEQAVSMFKEHSPHIVLMDINMPKMNGYQATKAIRELSSRVPIIAVTAYAYASDEQKITESGFNGYAAKPINPKMLKSQMINLLKRQLIFM